MINRTDLAVSLVLLAACGVLYYVTTTFEEVSPLFAQDMPPERFPRMLLWFIAVLSLLLPFERKLRGEAGKVLDKARKRPAQPIVYLSVAFLVVAVLSIEIIGTFFVLVAVCLGLPLIWGERRWKILIPFVVLFPAAVMLLFSNVLGVYFATGLIGIDFQ
ncbi:MAG TPA: tripartite tricarboxylate transporter TctB family protein [Gammaproteobacteria bacterium]|nr:tripartite tricarboxylate transporter TctB family protein [Gammaproteobacteria bacterium]